MIVMDEEKNDGKFEQLRAEIKKKWGHSMDDDLTTFGGRQDSFYGKMKEHYSTAREATEAKIKKFGAFFQR